MTQPKSGRSASVSRAASFIEVGRRRNLSQPPRPAPRSTSKRKKPARPAHGSIGERRSERTSGPERGAPQGGFYSGREPRRGGANPSRRERAQTRSLRSEIHSPPREFWARHVGNRINARGAEIHI